MGRSPEIFGHTTGEPATPGSYGDPPNGYRLPQATRLGPVRLQIGDLGRSVAYYQTTLGLRLLDRGAERAVLGTHGETVPLVELVERRGTRPAGRRAQLGLFHFAILLPDRASLGRLVRHLEKIGVRPGAGDHLVSESFYLQDPDNLGIEVYADRPRNTWRRIGRQLMMATDPIDLEGILVAGRDGAWTGMPPGTTMGHVHLHVGDLERASAFYSEMLGFDRMVWSYPGALFLAAGGYHHHLGTNIWAGPEAGAPSPDTAQLLEWTLALPDRTSLAEVMTSLTRGGIQVERSTTPEDDSFLIRDPWGTPLRLRL
jgi:catechol 2,3-dioxygenase